MNGQPKRRTRWWAWTFIALVACSMAYGWWYHDKPDTNYNNHVDRYVEKYGWNY